MATEFQNTPWTARRDGSGGEPGLWSVIDTKGAIVFFGMEESVARLFAAAPDMRAALKAALPHVEKLASFAPTTNERMGRVIQARKDRDLIRSSLTKSGA